MCRLDLNTFKWGYENSEYFLRHLVGAYAPDIGALAKKSNDNALSLVFKIANE